MTPLLQVLAAIIVLVAAVLFARHVFLALRMLWSGEASRLEEAREQKAVRSGKTDTTK